MLDNGHIFLRNAIPGSPIPTSTGRAFHRLTRIIRLVALEGKQRIYYFSDFKP